MGKEVKISKREAIILLAVFLICECYYGLREKILRR